MQSVRLKTSSTPDIHGDAGYRILMEAGLHQAGEPSRSILLHKVSTQGFSFSAARTLPAGSHLVLDIAQHRFMADLVDQDGQLHECAFLTPLTHDEARKIVAMSPVVWGEFGAMNERKDGPSNSEAPPTVKREEQAAHRTRWSGWMSVSLIIGLSLLLWALLLQILL